ncbi:Phox homologous domain-containing protein [Chaetomidium leptoderma]|uniref:Phox homologous domain-containing protein n=1 Tax=Chaetomidium leptoderma TaxID=669021 RepID=A0AAN6ZR39_9PEZI|nr:Phox homologous domain-containing protein [Chaetomidium leptoderma]
MAPPLEISIPTTSLVTQTDKNSKPYTLYNITIRLPLRSFVVQKRYSEFAALHTALTSLVPPPPPEPLPAKSWFRSTVSSPELTEQRRAGLERYLRAVAERPDRRWRDTPAWRAFLNLPSTSGASVSGVSVDGRVPAIGLRDANLAAACDPATWTDLHREMREELRAAQAALERRERVGGGGNSSALEMVEAGTQAKKALIKAGNLLAPLEEGLRVMKEAGRLGGGEFTRRRDVLEAARREKGLLDQLAANLARKSRAGGVAGGGGRDQDSASESDRAKLLMPQRPAGRQLGRPLAETEETRERDNSGMVQLNDDKMKEQDADLKVLGDIVHRQLELASQMERHIEEDNERLDHLNQQVDSHGRKLAVANRRAKNL